MKPIALNFMAPPLAKQVSSVGTSFNFLNISHDFKVGIDWNYEANGLLWSYNLNYMDYLLQSGISAHEGTVLIKDFIDQYDHNTVGPQPYTVSLRGMNWIKFLSLQQIHDHSINEHLFNQYRELCKKTEYHLLANHLLENGLSLLFGAVFFQNPVFWKKACRIVIQELEEQICQDGGHYEKSPMYHAILLERVLDCYNLLKSNAVFDNQQKILDLLRNKANTMLAWLNSMAIDGHGYPMFNDAVQNVSATVPDLRAYYSALELGDGTITSKLSDSGYRRLENDYFTCFLDVGKVGPDYQPGHAHSDIFNFELYCQGAPIIVDTGTSTYNVGKVRNKERSIRAHNTVEFNGVDPVDVYGGFRVGKRPDRIPVSQDDAFKVTASHNGYRDVGVVHERSFGLQENTLTIYDKLEGKLMDKSSIARFHLAHGIIPQQINNQVLTEKVKIIFEGYDAISIENYKFASGYNRYHNAPCVKVRFRNELCTRIEKL